MRLLILFALSLSLYACTTPSNKPQFKKVKAKQRVYVGKLEVVLNGQAAEKCEIYMNSDLNPFIRISKDGYLIYRTERKKPRLGRLSCLHRLGARKAAWHIQDFDLSQLERPKERKTAHYFGHLRVNWDIDPSKTAAVQPAGGFIRSGPQPIVKDSGELTVAVREDLEDIQGYAAKNWDILNDFKIEKKIVQLKEVEE